MHNSEEKLVKSASYLSVICALLILTIKLYGWLITKSESLFISLIDSMLDIFASLVNMIAIRIAYLPPDNEYRFGHQKFEDLAIFSQSIFFLTSCIFAIFSATKTFFYGSELTDSIVGVEAMLLATFLNICLVCYQQYVISKTRSNIIEADKLHYFSDLLTNVAVIISIYLSGKFWYLDPLVSIIIAVSLAYSSYKILRSAIVRLADQELPNTDKEKIINIIKSNNNIKGLHELKTRNAGNKIFIQFHIELDGSISLYESHNIADEISDALINSFPNADIIIHQDPWGVEHTVAYKEKI